MVEESRIEGDVRREGHGLVTYMHLMRRRKRRQSVDALSLGGERQRVWSQGHIDIVESANMVFGPDIGYNFFSLR